MEHIEENQILLYEELCYEPKDEDELRRLKYEETPSILELYPGIEEKAEYRKRFRENMGLIGYSINKVRPSNDSAIDIEDLYQVGYMALWRACKDFDESKGFEFSTYAVPSILGTLNTFLNRSSQVKTPRSYYEITRNIIKHQYTLPLSKEEVKIISEETGYSLAMIDSYRPMIVSSLDYSIDLEEGSSTLVDILADDNSYINLDYTEEQLESIVDELVKIAAKHTNSERHVEVIEEWLYSILEGEEISQSVLAKKYNVTRSAINRIINKSKQSWLDNKDKVLEILT